MPSAISELPAENFPIYWFVKLERAVEAGDFQAAADAQAELERLGVKVIYHARACGQEVASE